jgi:hypothetical protein
MGDRKLACLDVREDTKDGVLARARIDVHAIAGKPGQELRFGMHARKQDDRRDSEQMIFVGHVPTPRLRGGVPLAEAVTKTYALDLSTYPQWLVVLVLTLVAALAIWILIKLLKMALWLLFFAVLFGGFFWAGYLLLR